MKKVNPKWLKKKTNTVDFETLADLIGREKYVGFVPTISKDQRYMVMTSGEFTGTAVNTDGNWVGAEEQTTEAGDYYVFGSRKEPFGWLSESDEK